MLHGNAEFFLHVLLFDIAGLHQLILFRDLPGIAQELLSFRGQDNAAVASLKKLRSDLMFQLL